HSRWSHGWNHCLRRSSALTMDCAGNDRADYNLWYRRSPLPSSASMHLVVLVALTAVPAYLIGSVPFGYLVAKWRGIDIFRYGSGNIGATHVGRVLGKSYGLLVFLLDFLKGAIPVAAARALTPADIDLPSQTLPVTAGIAAFLGHLLPIYLRFRGGKGVATGAG